MRNHRRTRRGFTLIEVLLVLAILGMLAAVGAVAYFGIFEKAKVDTTKAKIDVVMDQLETYHMNVGSYPNTELGIDALMTVPDDEEIAKKWAGPYIKKPQALRDAWDNMLESDLLEDEQNGKFVSVPRVSSAGPDGQPGNDDDIRGWDEEEQD